MTLTIETAAGVLSAVRLSRRGEHEEQVAQLELACEWAYQHPAEAAEIDAATFGDSPVTVAGPGAPLVSEFCVAEFAAAMGMATEPGKYFIGEALEIRHRLPRLWKRVKAGQVPVWRARRIARETIALTQQAAGFVDEQVADSAEKVGVVVLDRLVAEAMARFMPEEAAEKAAAALDRRQMTVDHRQVSMNGTSRVYGELDLPDAQDFDAAITAEAERMAKAGCTEPLAIRRAKAVGTIARRDLGINNPTTAAKKTELVVHVAPGSNIAREQKTGAPISIDTVRAWLTNPSMTVVVKPVIDLADHIHVAQYEVPDRLGFQVDSRDQTCVFPWCQRPATGCDHDHVVPYAEGGTTCSCNIVPQCRSHHRLKTHHGGWTVTVLEPGTYLWRSPHGHHYLRDHTGTRDTTHDRAGP